MFGLLFWMGCKPNIYIYHHPGLSKMLKLKFIVISLIFLCGGSFFNHCGAFSLSPFLFLRWGFPSHSIQYFYLFSLLKKLVRDFVYLFWLKCMKVPLWVFISFMRVFPHYIRSHLVVISLVYYWFDCIIVVVEVEQIELVQVKNYALYPMHVHIPKINSISPTPIMLNFLSFKPLTYLMILHWSMT